MAKNQCDGCRQKLPIIDGVHYKDNHPWIGCTKARYETKPEIHLDSKPKT